MDGQAGHFPQDVPAGDIDGGLNVGVSAQHRVHPPVEHVEVARVEADQFRGDLGQSRAHARRIGRQIGRAQRAAFAKTVDAGIGRHLDHGRIEDLDEIVVGPAIAAFLERQIDLIGADGGDLHGGAILSH